MEDLLSQKRVKGDDTLFVFLVKKLAKYYTKEKQYTKAIHLLQQLKKKDLQVLFSLSRLYETLENIKCAADNCLLILKEEPFAIQLVKRLLSMGCPHKNLVSYYKQLDKKHSPTSSLKGETDSASQKKDVSLSWAAPILSDLVLAYSYQHLNLHKSKLFLLCFLHFATPKATSQSFIQILFLLAKFSFLQTSFKVVSFQSCFLTSSLLFVNLSFKN